MLDLLYPNINLAKVQSQRDEIFIAKITRYCSRAPAERNKIRVWIYLKH